jgi:hypothetical protein
MLRGETTVFSVSHIASVQRRVLMGFGCWWRMYNVPASRTSWPLRPQLFLAGAHRTNFVGSDRRDRHGIEFQCGRKTVVPFAKDAPDLCGSIDLLARVWASYCTVFSVQIGRLSYYPCCVPGATRDVFLLLDASPSVRLQLWRSEKLVTLLNHHLNVLRLVHLKVVHQLHLLLLVQSCAPGILAPAWVEVVSHFKALIRCISLVVEGR